MSFMDDLSSEIVATTMCSVGKWISGHDDDELTSQVLEALYATDDAGGWVFPGAAITRALRNQGVRIHHDTINRHRRRSCTCPPIADGTV